MGEVVDLSISQIIECVCVKKSESVGVHVCGVLIILLLKQYTVVRTFYFFISIVECLRFYLPIISHIPE